MADRSVAQKAQRGGGGRWPDFFRGVRGAGEDARRALTRPDQTQSNGRRSPPVAVAADDHTEKSVSPEPRILLPAGRCSTRRRPHFVLSRALLCWLSCCKWRISTTLRPPCHFCAAPSSPPCSNWCWSTPPAPALPRRSLFLSPGDSVSLSLWSAPAVCYQGWYRWPPCASDFAGSGALTRRVIVRWADGDNPMLVGVPGRRTSV